MRYDLQLEVEWAPSPVDPGDSPGLIRSLRRVLVNATRSAGLAILELRVVGSPELATAARGSIHGRDGVALWTASSPPCSWHDGLLLVACADVDTACRRQIVNDAADLINELVVSDRRRLQAEALANRAISVAGIDPLTQLGNRRTWRQALDEESTRAARYEAETTLAVIDLDGLKGINDSQGHAAGDSYLVTAARAVKAGSRRVDVVCRLGGDEFGVLAPETGAEGAGVLAHRLLRALDEAGVRASIGVATTSSGDLDCAWQDADTQMYAQKRQRLRPVPAGA